MIPLAPSLVVAAASAFVGASTRARHALSAVWPDMDAEGTRFVHHVGYWALYDGRTGRSSWPLTGDCMALAAFADRNLSLESVPQFGDVILLHDPVLDASRAGFVEHVSACARKRGELVQVCGTIEWSAAEGAALRAQRIFGDHDRLVRWADLELQRAA